MSNCESCKKQVLEALATPLPCTTPNCETTIDINCIIYTGTVCNVAGITTGMTVKQVLEKLANYTSNCNCDLVSSFVLQSYPCSNGLRLEYSDSSYTVKWEQFDTFANAYLDIFTFDLIKDSTTTKYIETLPFSALSNYNATKFKVTLTKAGCPTVIKEIDIQESCGQLDLCNLSSDAFVKNPTTGDQLYFNFDYGFPSWDLKRESQLLCGIFPNMTKEQCESFTLLPSGNTYTSMYFQQYIDFRNWEKNQVFALMTDNPNAIAANVPSVPPPIPHVHDFYNYGQERANDPNYKWIKIPVRYMVPMQIFGTTTIFYIKYLPHVANTSLLPSTGNLGDVCYVNDGNNLFYSWDPLSSSWLDTNTHNGFVDPADGTQTVDFETARLAQINQIIAYWKAFYELQTATRPMMYSQLLMAHRIQDIHVRKIQSGSGSGNCGCTCEYMN